MEGQLQVKETHIQLSGKNLWHPLGSIVLFVTYRHIHRLTTESAKSLSHPLEAISLKYLKPMPYRNIKVIF